MRNNETGEFELLVGNRQLLSGFFIVVLLFAVAFSMGYIVGRNSSPSAKLQTETGFLGRRRVPDAETVPNAASQAPAAGGAPARLLSSRPTPAGGAADTPPQPSTQPERGPEPLGARSGCPGPPRRPAAAAPPTEAAPGSYWQVLATASQASADAMRQDHERQGLPGVSCSPAPTT